MGAACSRKGRAAHALEVKRKAVPFSERSPRRYSWMHLDLQKNCTKPRRLVGRSWVRRAARHCIQDARRLQLACLFSLALAVAAQTARVVQHTRAEEDRLFARQTKRCACARNRVWTTAVRASAGMWTEGRKTGPLAAACACTARIGGGGEDQARARCRTQSTSTWRIPVSKTGSRRW